ncbi:unnamed protein product [marine sediment metagenome]|uniref:PD-(D/E)XK endonuclease-like domain-containing protein n=1 Tax=marine sediment metagenome TaxID=412755 RepID=X1ENM2_9ZZZZ
MVLQKRERRRETDHLYRMYLVEKMREIKRINVYDFKTDATEVITKEKFIEDMKKRYQKQMEAYRFAVRKLFKRDNVRVFLILTSILEIIEV